MTSGMAVVLAALALSGALGVAPARADDDWDLTVDSDDGPETDNVLFHGAEQVHDLDAPPADQDWYLVRNHPFSSYQMVVDGLSRLQLEPADMQLLGGVGPIVLQTSTATDRGGVLSLNWLQGTGSMDVFVRVHGASCGTQCVSADTYRIRFYDTTYTLPRFNNTGTQSTVLLVQNVTEQSCFATYHFFTGGGAVVATGRSLPARGLDVFATASLVGGASGSVRIAHNCGYGGLSGKAVALEPATGFTFDTPLVARPN